MTSLRQVYGKCTTSLRQVYGKFAARPWQVCGKSTTGLQANGTSPRQNGSDWGHLDRHFGAPESAPDLGAFLGAQTFINDFHSKWGAPGWRTTFLYKI